MGKHKANGILGFRDLECFNKALLAKQLWRLVTKPWSLVATILREKYCKTENIITACVKGHSLLLWKSLMAIQKVLEISMRWKVGNETKIKILEDIWLPSWGTFQVQSPNKLIPNIAIVNELIKDIETAWNEELINFIF